MTNDLVGTTLGGYKLISVIGKGGMATVYKAYQPNLERWVAVKVLNAKLDQEMQALARFNREAKAIAALRHRNILIVYDYCEEGQWPYIVMEYVEGGSLREMLADSHMEWTRALNLTIPVAEALEFAHSQGIIHRDVKPANILMAQEDWPLLADFGLVKLPGKGESNTLPGMYVGTAGYVSPEQAQGADVAPGVDIYSLSVVLFEMVVGRLPFDYEHPAKVLLAHIAEEPPSPRGLKPDNVPPMLDEVILKGLQKDPKSRFADMKEMIEALKEVLASSKQRPPFYEEGPPATIPCPQCGTQVRAGQRFCITCGLQLFDTGGTGTGIAVGAPPAGDEGSGYTILPSSRRSVPGEETTQEARLFVPDKNAVIKLVNTGQQIIIGRTHREQVADVDLGPYGARELGVSRRHAMLTCEGGRWMVSDMNSTNGTFVNEVRISPGQPVTLNDGDMLRFGRLPLVFFTSSSRFL